MPYRFFTLPGLILLINLNAHAASFDCTKALSQTEKLICADAELSQLDSELGMLFQANKTTKPQLIQEQKKWLHERRNTCQENACLETAYVGRIQEVKTNDICPVTENSLLGSWVRVKNGFFEEMNFSIRQEKSVFILDTSSTGNEWHMGI